MGLKSVLEELGLRIRQKLCRHCFAMGQAETKRDDYYYTFTHVCVKCGKNYVVKIPRDFIDSDEEWGG